MACNQSNYASARSLREESLTIFRELGDKWSIALALGNLGLVAYYQGDYAPARSLQEESLTIRRELKDQWGIALSLVNLGHIARSLRDDAPARAQYAESLAIFQELGDKSKIAEVVEGFASLYSSQAQPERGARLWGAAEVLREAIGYLLPSNDRAEYTRNVTAARETLGAEAFATAWMEGRAMTTEQAIASVLKEISHKAD